MEMNDSPIVQKFLKYFFFQIFFRVFRLIKDSANTCVIMLNHDFYLMKLILKDQLQT